MRWFKRVLLAFAALVLLLIVGLAVLSADEKAQVARFYDAHPMLQMMDKIPAILDRERVDVLLQRVPKGSTRKDAAQILSSEGMSCSHAQSSQRLLTCDLKDREPAHLIPRWVVEVQFDENDKVSGGRVLALKATY